MQFGFIWVHWFIAEIERIYGIRNGGDRKSEIKRNNVPLDNSPQTMSELAERFGVNEKTLREAIRISKLPSDLQQMVMDGKVTASTASRVIARLSPEEQKKLAEAIPTIWKSLSRFSQKRHIAHKYLEYIYNMDS